MRSIWFAGCLAVAMTLWGGPAASAAPARGDAATPKSAGTGLVATINLSQQSMTVTVDGAPVHTWPISSGAPGRYQTPTGTFRPQWTAKMHYSTKYDDAPMPNSVFFNGGIAVHGTQSIGRLGTPASHGCVRLAPANALAFYNLVHRHGLQSTRIIVRGSTPSAVYARRQDRTERYALADRYPRTRSVMTYDRRIAVQPRYVIVRQQPSGWFTGW